MYSFVKDIFYSVFGDVVSFDCNVFCFEIGFLEDGFDCLFGWVGYVD